MQQAQIIAYGVEGALAGRLKELGQAHGLWVRPVQHLKTCRNVLRQRSGPTVLVLMIGRDLVRELALVQEVSHGDPTTAIIVIGDTDNPALAALAWDLGARCVLQPPQPIELLPDLVLRCLAVEA